MCKGIIGLSKPVFSSWSSTRYLMLLLQETFWNWELWGHSCTLDSTKKRQSLVLQCFFVCLFVFCCCGLGLVFVCLLEFSVYAFCFSFVFPTEEKVNYCITFANTMSLFPARHCHWQAAGMEPQHSLFHWPIRDTPYLLCTCVAQMSCTCLVKLTCSWCLSPTMCVQINCAAHGQQSTHRNPKQKSSLPHWGEPKKSSYFYLYPWNMIKVWEFSHIFCLY